MILEKTIHLRIFTHFLIEVAFPFFYNMVIAPFSKTIYRYESLLVTCVNIIATCGRKRFVTIYLITRRTTMPEIKARNVAFRLPTSTQLIFVNAPVINFELASSSHMNYAMTEFALLATLKLFAIVYPHFCIHPKK